MLFPIPKLDEVKRHVPEWLRRRPLPDSTYQDLAMRLQVWLAGKDLAESALVLDGPGYGCTLMYPILGLLGDARIARLREIHTFSGSSYAILCYLAQRRGQLIWPTERIEQWNIENIRRHGVKPGITLAKAITGMIRRKTPVFSGDLCETALALTVSPDFLQTPVADLPENVRFWTYNVTAGRFESIDAKSPLRHLTVGQVGRAVAGIPGLYDPFVYRGCQYIDPLWAPGVRAKFKEIRQGVRHCLFGHMQRDGLHGNTLFIRLHPDTSSYRRLGVDFAYFMLGVDNPQVMQNFRRGLYDLQPVPEADVH